MDLIVRTIYSRIMLNESTSKFTNNKRLTDHLYLLDTSTYTTLYINNVLSLEKLNQINKIHLPIIFLINDGNGDNIKVVINVSSDKYAVKYLDCPEQIQIVYNFHADKIDVDLI